MTEREFYISIIPDLAELIVELRDLCQEEREQIKEEMLNNCKIRPQAYRMIEKLWIVIDSQLKEKSTV
ncbi:hypothetical protein [Roseburia hominis]|uniref:hypothetical protein n=1 Tax=Roseburia hominis TaxID=301301 RepID=UPI002659073C|nr:hypothetical protein [Roseburia hominis]